MFQPFSCCFQHCVLCGHRRDQAYLVSSLSVSWRRRRTRLSGSKRYRKENGHALHQIVRRLLAGNWSLANHKAYCTDPVQLQHQNHHPLCHLERGNFRLCLCFTGRGIRESDCPRSAAAFYSGTALGGLAKRRHARQSKCGDAASPDTGADIGTGLSVLFHRRQHPVPLYWRKHGDIQFPFPHSSYPIHSEKQNRRYVT